MTNEQALNRSTYLFTWALAVVLVFMLTTDVTGFILLGLWALALVFFVWVVRNDYKIRRNACRRAGMNYDFNTWLSSEDPQ